MRKLKIILGLVYAFLAVLLFHFCMLIAFWDSFGISQANDPIFGDLIGYWTIGFSIVYFVVFSLIALGILQIIKKGFFNDKASRMFSVSGWALLISGICQGCVDIARMYSNDLSESNGDLIQVLLSFFLIILGLGILFIVDLMKNGLQIKSENDLTI